ncbi:PREDICTED: ATG8-interacting protein 2-like [Tarenaya hassleriana]|uniref:ATG8-interacting protein 2-like n=1 Tax=Tarenaya hassleriana TaxID=28532 RepID=UPI00053C7D44|nr:PREDICTED: ATG8-interacting protein 2-like [Tarenaya hassleriana]
MEGDSHDWELLHESDIDSIESQASYEKSSNSSEVDGVSFGVFRTDHFSVENLVERSGKTTDPSGNEFVKSDAKTGDERKTTDSGIPKVSDRKHVESQAAAEETGKTLPCNEDSSKSWSDSGGEVLVSGDSGATTKENEFVSNSGLVSSEAMVGNEVRIVEREAHSVNLDAKTGDERKKSGMVWWKMPFVLLKYCGFKIGPVWTVSMAAAVMGLALLGRRLYNVKKKARRFQLKVTIDDKKVSRVMSQAARLNEAFTEVRRVPVIRPALPSPGANPWPVLSLR